MYIERVHIKDLRCFADATIDFVHPDAEGNGPLRNVTLLLGNNGVGKTTVLRAIALGALNIALNQSGYVPYSMVRRAPSNATRGGSVEALLIAHGQDVDGELSARVAWTFDGEVHVTRRGDVEHMTSLSGWTADLQIYSEGSAGVLVLGYGSTRRIDPASEFSRSQRRRLRVLRYDRVANLFEEQLSLAPLAAWLPEIARNKPDLYIRICDLLKQLIPADTRFTGELDGDEYLFERGGIKVGFAALSDGYRGYIGLLGDIFYHLCTGLKDDDEPTQSRGIVLIDEIDQHLHPAWQRVVIPTLANTLPNLQFVLTSHSPIIAGTVYAKNIRLLETDQNGISHLELLEEEIHGLNADQVLLTEAFGLRSSRSPDFVEKFEQATRDLDPDNWQDALRLMRMLNRGSAGEAEPEPEPSKPARKPAGVMSAEDRSGKKRSAQNAAKTKTAKKKSTKKKFTKR